MKLLCNYLVENLKMIDVPWQSKEILLSFVFCRDDMLTTLLYDLERKKRSLPDLQKFIFKKELIHWFTVRGF